MHYKERFRVFEALQKVGVFEISEPAHEEELWSGYIRKEQLAYESAQFDQIILFLERYESKKGFWRTLKEGSKQEISPKDAQNAFLYCIKNGFDVQSKQLEDEIIEREAHLRELEEEKEVLIHWKDLSFDFSLLQKTDETKTLFFSVEEKEVEDFFDACGDFSDCLYEAHGNNVALTYHIEDEKRIEDFLSKFNIKRFSFPNVTLTISDRLKEIQSEEERYKNELEDFEEKARALARELPHLRAAAQYMHWEEAKQNAISDGASTRETLLYEGWVPKKKKNTLEAELSKITDLYAIEVVEQKETDIVPVEIENHKVFKPFEAVTRLYGLPAHNDIDPTAFLAGFFFIFFGFALSDVGYGITLALVSFLAVFFIKLPKDTRLLLTLLGLGGVSSIILGVVFGGYLGIPLEYLPEWLVSLKKLDPITSPISILLLALFLGVIQIVVGLFLDIYRAYKNNLFLDGLLDKGPWIYLFFAVFATLLNVFNYAPVLPFPYVYLIYIGIIALVITQGRKEKTIFGKLFKGIFSLYDSVGFFSDILSYSRLLALGLATTAISFAVDTIALIVRDLVPVVGFFLMIVILVVGHIFNLAVNTLGAFIHGARLQFVEFFTKFITGTGRAFKPFAKEERFIVLKD